MRTIQVANIILNYFIRQQNPIRNMKLQKLLFFSCGWYVVLKNKAWLINHDFYAWPYGPVCPLVYHQVSRFQNKPIVTEITDEHIDYTRDEEIEGIIYEVIRIFGRYSDWELSNITHRAHTPWSDTVNNNSIGAKIDRMLIYSYYKKVQSGYFSK